MAIEALSAESCEITISKAEVRHLIAETNRKGGISCKAFRTLYTGVDDLPPVTPQPQMGWWIEHEHNGIAYIECSKCSVWFLRAYLTRNSYCPNCGAKMGWQEARAE